MQCKYYDLCEHSSPKAKTCVEHGGGTYCGKYRLFTEKQTPGNSPSNLSTSLPVRCKEILA